MAKAAMVIMIALVTVMSGGEKFVPDTDKDTFECSETEAEKLIRIGAAKRAEDTGSADNSNTGTKDPLLTLKKEELIALAAERNVTIPEGVTMKADIIAFLNSSEGQGNA